MKVFKLYVVVFCLCFFATKSWGGIQGDWWIVKKGDTLYGISRAVYPKNARLQAELRKDIIRLNSAVFKKGKGGLYIGAKLRLPERSSPGMSASIKSKINNENPVKKIQKVVEIEKKKQPTMFLLKENRWPVSSGDSLYSIAKKFFPSSSRKQFKLRQDIFDLNPDVFSAGKNTLEMGYVLIMPDYVVEKTEPAAQMSAQNEADSDSEEHGNVTVYQPHSNFNSKWSLSLGYSEGGDIAQTTQGGRDIEFGSGMHLRLNVDGLWKSRHGYRMALGYQYDKVTAGASDSAELAQSDFQLLYLFNGRSSVFGIGASYHDKIVFELDTVATGYYRADYKPAAAATMLYEYKRFFGGQIIGFAYSAFESEMVQNTTKIDFTRTEFYLRWMF
ncbi:MAG: LysM peptidoglycan-binding domain-containing protein [Gammaproteobacteria bacterium]|nr:LysM peptidoglycan-binding domain-containing protein [Gammaproteobacteria bacterium]